MLPKAKGGAAVTHLDAKLTAHEAIHGLPYWSIGVVIAIATETAAALFLAGTDHWPCKPTAHGPHRGCRGPLRRTRR